jgi:transposase
MLDEIQRYTASIETGTLCCNLATCPRCGERPSGFTQHDRRRRTFLVLLAGLVYKVRSALPRWKCPICSKTFTFYPAFALPHKRYVRDAVLEKASRYVEDDTATYRTTVREQGLTLGYASSAEGVIDNRSLSHTAVHKWLTSLAGLTTTLRRATQLIRQKSSTSTIFRTFLPLARAKYRSETRRQELMTCRRLFQADREYRLLFGASVFPHLGTVCAWK